MTNRMKIAGSVLALLVVFVVFALPSAAEHEGRNSESWLLLMNSSLPSDRSRAVAGLAGLARTEDVDRNPLQRFAVGCGDALGLRSSESPALNGLLTALSDPDIAVRTQAVDSLAGLGAIATPVLKRAIVGGDVATLRGIESVLEKSPGVLESSDVATLVARLKSEEAASPGKRTVNTAGSGEFETIVEKQQIDLERAERIRAIEEDPNLTGDQKMRRIGSLGYPTVPNPGPAKGK